MDHTERVTLGALGRLFFKLGCVAFGGPAAHIAMMEDEVVSRRNWIPREHFLDLIGATQIIPGPNSTEMVLHVGYEKGGWKGMLTAGVAFIFPAAVLTGLVAWFYVKFGSLPAIAPLLAGIKPAIVAVIAVALYRLGKKAIKSHLLFFIGAAVLLVQLLGVNELAALAGGTIVGMAAILIRERKPPTTLKSVSLPLIGFLSYVMPAPQSEIQLWKLILFFLKVGAVLYGSGYVLIAFLEGDLVNSWGWLTEGQLLDAIAMGQLTPGPVLTTATFIGYLLAGVPGAIGATIAIFLPSFVFVSILNPIIPKLRKSVWTAAFLDAVVVSSFALMAAVTITLGVKTLITPVGIIIFLASLVALLKYRISSVIIMLVAGSLGAILQWVSPVGLF